MSKSLENPDRKFVIYIFLYGVVAHPMLSTLALVVCAAFIVSTASEPPTVISTQQCNFSTPSPRFPSVFTQHELSLRTPVHFLVTGCPRSGTRFIAKFFDLNGFRVSHERYRPGMINATFQQYPDEGIVSWVMGVETDRTPWGPAASRFSFTHIFHQVRNPLDTIGSILRNEKVESWEYVCPLLPQIKNCLVGKGSLGKFSLVERSAAFWYHWNLLAERRSELTYSIDSFSQATLSKLEQTLRIESGRLKLGKRSAVSKRMAGRSYRTLSVTWRELYFCISAEVFNQVTCLADRYGYNVTEARALQQHPPNTDRILATWVTRVSNKLPAFSRVHLAPRQLWTRLCCQGYVHNGAMCLVALDII